MATHHRGPAADDARLFGPARVETLRRAAEEVAWLLGRGYSSTTAVAAVGNHHQLEQRQRVALGRACCSAQTAAARRAKALAPSDVAGRALHVDGFNLVIALETALGGGVLLEGPDGALRDLAGLRGTWRPVVETEPALRLVSDMITQLRPSRVRWVVDAPVSNSGRLAALVRATQPAPVSVEAVPNADAVLAGLDGVVSADSVVIDASASWANLAAWVVAAHVPSAWRVVLAP